MNEILLNLVQEVARLHGLTVADVMAKRGTTSACSARRDLVNRLRREPYSKSYREIAQLLGRARSTVMDMAGDTPRFRPDRLIIGRAIAAIDAAREEMRVT